jgi:hypothetical protein
MVLDFVGGLERHDTRPLDWLPRVLSFGRLGIVALLISLIPGRRESYGAVTSSAGQLSLPRLVLVCVASLFVARFVTGQIVDNSLMFHQQARFAMVHFTYLVIAGALALVLVLVSGGKRQWAELPSLRNVWHGAAFGLASFLLLYLIVANFVESHFFHVTLNDARLPRFLLMATLSLPIVIVAGYFKHVALQVGF